MSAEPNLCVIPIVCYPPQDPRTRMGKPRSWYNDACRFCRNETVVDFHTMACAYCLGDMPGDEDDL